MRTLTVLASAAGSAAVSANRDAMMARAVVNFMVVNSEGMPDLTYA
jgi:hypothetical protein